MHTSTVTVAVIDPSITTQGPYSRRADSDFKIEWYSGSGCGGQFRNKHQNSCRIQHIPTGIIRKSEGRERTSNLRDAMAAIHQALDEAAHQDHHGRVATDRKSQVGSGQRGDKMRTYRFQNNLVTDDRTGRQAKTDLVMRGQFDLLW